ncbi:VanZ family protein [Roseovarius sp. SYSU LYC5161]|uniref:VanZ family protein n=1 Tax=Roseovarius halophilus (ex Wu et al. 2025) TaxID=3376060 RepID=UPI003999527E
MFDVTLLTKYRLYLLGLVLTIALGVVIALLTLAPLPSQNVPGSDKMHHLLGFMALAFPLPLARPRLVWPVILAVAAYGGLIEIVQPVFGRSAELGDFIGDVIGATLGALLGVQCGKWLRRSRIVK